MALRRALRPFAALVFLVCTLHAGDIEGVVKGPDGKPVPGAAVAATPDAPNALSDGDHAARVGEADAQGRFHLADLPEGSYGTTATAPGLGSAFVGEVAVPAKGAVEGLVLPIQKGGVTYEGMVQAPRGKTLEGLQVFAGRVSEDSGDCFYAEVKDGHYRLSLGTGSYRVQASAAGLMSDILPLQIPAVGGLTRSIRLFPVEGSDPDLAAQLRAMAEADQQARKQSVESQAAPAAVEAEGKVDARNDARLGELIKTHGWPTATMVGFKGAGDAWIIVHHGNIAFLKEHLPAMKRAAEEGELPWAMVAMSIDRDRVHDGKPQVYGTQFAEDKQGNPQLGVIEDVAHVDERREAVGLEPITAYLAEQRRIKQEQWGKRIEH